MSKKVLVSDLDNRNKPRERLENIGAHALSDMELIAIILGSGGKEYSILDMSNYILKKYKNIKNFFSADLNSLRKIKYIGRNKSILIKAVYEVSKRVILECPEKNEVINSPKKAYGIIKKDVHDLKQEHIYLLSLDSRKRLISKDLISIGDSTQSLVPIREIVYKAVEKNALYIILVHNHPSNDLEPSTEDLGATKSLNEALEQIGIFLLDHLIVGKESYLSLRSINLIK